VVTAVPVEAERPPRASAPKRSVPAVDRIAVAEASGPAPDPASLPPVGTAGVTAAGLAAFAAFRSEGRRRWWFLLWTFGLGVAGLALLAAWAGPGIVAV
jgi:hypothetical protein